MMQMDTKIYLKKYGLSLAFLVGIGLFYLFIRLAHPSVSVFDLKEKHNILSFCLLFVVMLLPIVWLFVSTEWEKEDITQKVLLVGITTAILTTTYSYQTVTAGVVVFALCVLFYLYKQRKIYKPDPIYYLFFAYFLIHVVSLLWVKNIEIGLRRIDVYIPFVIIPLLFCFFRLRDKEIKTIMFVFYKGIVIFIFISLCCWLYQSAFYDIPLSEWLTLKKKYIIHEENTIISIYNAIFAWSNYPHPTYNSLGYLFGLAVGFFLYKKGDEKKISWVELLLVILSSLLLLVITQSRTGLVMWLLVVFFGLAFLLKEKKKILGVYLACSIIAACLFGFCFSAKISDFLNDATRRQNIDTSWAYIKSNPWLGTGVGGMAEIMDSNEFAQSLGYPKARVQLANPHNQFLGDLMQTGILGLTISCLMVFYIFYKSIKHRNWLLFMFQMCYLQVMLIEMPLYLSKGIFYYLLFCCLLLQYKAGYVKKE